MFIVVFFKKNQFKIKNFDSLSAFGVYTYVAVFAPLLMRTLRFDARFDAFVNAAAFEVGFKFVFFLKKNLNVKIIV